VLSSNKFAALLPLFLEGWVQNRLSYASYERMIVEEVSDRWRGRECRRRGGIRDSNWMSWK
jgi:hypothetical protein